MNTLLEEFLCILLLTVVGACIFVKEISDLFFFLFAAFDALCEEGTATSVCRALDEVADISVPGNVFLRIHIFFFKEFNLMKLIE